jgi:hypothetical protein
MPRLCDRWKRRDGGALVEFRIRGPWVRPASATGAYCAAKSEAMRKIRLMLERARYCVAIVLAS